MKVQFKFDNGTSQIILTPESAREKQLYQLAMEQDHRHQRVIKLMPSTDDSLVFEISDGTVFRRDGIPIKEKHDKDCATNQGGLCNCNLVVYPSKMKI